MTTRTLYLVGYDVACPLRLRRLGRFLRGYRVEGQKSAYECWVAPAEFEEIRAGIRDRIDAGEDRVHIFQLDPRMEVRCFGTAVTFAPRPFLVV